MLAWRPFVRTRIRFDGEYGRGDEIAIHRFAFEVPPTVFLPNRFTF